MVGSDIAMARPALQGEEGSHGLPYRLSFHTPRATAERLALKRLMDLAGAFLAGILTAPLWLAAALAIRLDDGGPVLFRQERVGARPRHVGGRTVWEPRTFVIYKFRTMTVDADPEVHRTLVQAYAHGAAPQGADPDAAYKHTHDPRITRMGKLLRRTSLDELPQLINVLLGDMSLVGPRPLPLYEIAEYEEWHFERLCAVPGITGLWQVAGRGNTSFDEGTRMDVEYVRHWSLGLDLRLLLRTLPAILSRRGAG